MQWLTAILAFATTMLIFAVIVTALVETLNRACASRAKGFEEMLRYFFRYALEPHLSSSGNTTLTEHEFVRAMVVVRTPISKASAITEKPNPYSYRRLSELPLTSFMERLGNSEFSTVLKDNTEQEKQILKDIAQKYENCAEEASLQFESGARLKSVLMASVVAWTFCVHPYDLMYRYLEKPEVAAKVASLKVADEYDEVIGDLKNLSNVIHGVDKPQISQSPQDVSVDEVGASEDSVENIPKDDDSASKQVQELIKELREDIDSAKDKVKSLNDTGAPIGWEGKDKKYFECLGFKIPYPVKPTDWLWLLFGGLLIGLGAPFWAKLIKQLTPRSETSKNIEAILKEQSDTPGANQPHNKPVASEAFRVSAAGRRN